MLIKFGVSNFRGFQHSIILDLSQHAGYDFHKEFIQEDTVNKVLLFGKNGSGKSNLGFALADIVPTLTTKWVSPYFSGPNFKNLSNDPTLPAQFSYTFKFGQDIVTYSYSKNALHILIEESFFINGRLACHCLHSQGPCSIDVDQELFPELAKAQFDLSGYSVSLVRYLLSSGLLSGDNIFAKIMDFANRFLWFRSLRNNDFTGFHDGTSLLDDSIIRENKVQEFEAFLKKNEIDYQLKPAFENGSNVLYVNFPKGKLHFTEVASAGTLMLELIFYWSMYFASQPSFLFVDEFDAFYHYETAENIFAMLAAKLEFQSILTTHDTYLMQNSIIRPDCVFLIKGNDSLKSLDNCTDRELREAHNIEKIYRNGGFCE